MSPQEACSVAEGALWLILTLICVLATPAVIALSGWMDPEQRKEPREDEH